MNEIFAWMSAFLTVAAAAGLVSLLGERLCRPESRKKLRYLCALAVAASLSAPLPGFLATLQRTAAGEGTLTGEASHFSDSKNVLGSRLFSKAAGESLGENAGTELREKLDLAEEELTLFFTVEKTPEDDSLFVIQSVRAELYSLRAIAKTEEVRAYLTMFDCPVTVEEHLLDGGT